ncbi:MAG TPA: hypothetical protein PK490_21490 [Prosthecobacter sp.]|nr:hypothetical protein [Prosthecobacter sp.]
MKIIQSLLTLLTVACMASCKSSSINLPLDHVKTSDGYLNSSSLDFGHVLVWDTTTNKVINVEKITSGRVPSATVHTGPRFAQKKSSVSSENNVEIGFGTVPEAVKADAKAKFINSTKFEFTNFNPREFNDARYVLNSPEMRTWREQLVDAYSDPRFRFIFISRVTDADRILIGRERNGLIGADVNVVNSGNYKFETSYDQKTEVTIDAAGAPLTIQPAVFTFSVNGSELRFRPDWDSKFHFQKVSM